MISNFDMDNIIRIQRRRRHNGVRLAILTLVGFMAVLIFSSAPAVAGITVGSLRFQPGKDVWRFVFDLSGRPETYKVFIKDGTYNVKTGKAEHKGTRSRVVVDLKNTDLPAQIQQPPASHPLIRGIRCGRHKGDLRVVFDLNGKLQPQSFLLAPDASRGHRLVLDLRRPGNKSESVAVTKPESRKALAGDAEETPSSARRIVLRKTGSATPSPASGVQPVKVATDSASRDFVIAIDAGHGGNDPGARGRLGTKEKDVVLSVARKLQTLVNKEPGMKAVMIRDGDYYIGLQDRIQKARDAHADLFISIHADSYQTSEVSGSSVYMLSDKRASSEAARLLAKHENASDVVGGISTEGMNEMLTKILIDLSQNASREASSKVAHQVLKNLKRVGDVHNHKVQEAGFAVLTAPDFPSVLVETAYISNPAEEKKLRSGAYQKKLARSIFQGIRGYYANHTRAGVQVATRKHVISAGETLSEIALKYQVSMDRLQSLNTLPDKHIKAGQVLEIPEDS